jgi:hypothetical protein
VLGLALCFWLVAFATHVHGSADDFPAPSPSNACSFCLSLPSGATPPAHVAIALTTFISLERIADIATALATRAVPSFYLSRGPPAF